MSAISVGVLLESIAAMESARRALCKHPDTALEAFEVARVLGKLRAHVDGALPATVEVDA